MSNQQPKLLRRADSRMMTGGFILYHQPAVHRGQKEIIRAALQFVKAENGNATRTRILYATHSNSKYFPRLLMVMLENGLIRGLSMTLKSDYQRFAITTDGLRALQLLDELAAMIPDAPWILENTE